MNLTISLPQAARWLVENGAKELEMLLRSIISTSFVPILVTDNDRNHRDASFAAGKLLGLPREEIIGRRFDDFADPSYRSLISDRWGALRDRGEQQGALRLLGAGRMREVEYIAKGNVLPERHLLVLRDTATQGRTVGAYGDGGDKTIPSWAQDFGLFLLDADGQLVAWYAGAERMYGYAGDEARGRNVSILYLTEDADGNKVRDELARAAGEGHFVQEHWHVRKDKSRFWANIVIMALKNDHGDLQGFAGVSRDFSNRRQRDEELRLILARLRPPPEEPSVAAIVSGEFNQIVEANDRFLALVGYSRQDLLAGRLLWRNLTPPQYFPLDELVHEEALHFGAGLPVEKELIRKDGTRVSVLVFTAVLKLSPFRWITYIRELGQRDWRGSVGSASARQGGAEIIGSSPAIERILGQIGAVAATDATVLIRGESGTGKTLIARAVHKMSPRRDCPFVTLNCANVPVALLESELFGYESGAFPGTLSQKIGRLEMAHGGSLLLREVGDMPLELASKLRRALHEKGFERLGGTIKIHVDARLLATTRLAMAQMVGDKLFRTDFFYQLKVFPIIIPPLRDRPEDIPILARHFTKKFAAQLNRTIDKIQPETLKALANWHWPGNVRELEKFIEKSVTLSRGPYLRAPVAELRGEEGQGESTATLAEVEREHILRVLRETEGVISVAAARLGIPRTTLNAMMKRLGVSRGDF